MLKTETVIDIKLETVIPVNSAKVIITVTLYAIRFLNSLSYSFFFVTNIYICIYFYLQQMLLKKLCYHTFHK